MGLRLARYMWLLGIFVIFPSFTQSLEELENEVLSGKGTAPKSAETKGGMSETNNNPAPVLEENVDASQLSNTKQANDDASVSDDESSFTKDKGKKDVDPSVYKNIDDMLTGPKSIPLNHIFVVKQQYIFNTNRHEIIPFTLGIQPSDSFRKQLSMGFSYLYHLTESLSIEAVHANFFTNISTGFANELSSHTGLEIERIEPVISLGSALQWAPFRGKSATAENIYHFEGYMFLGGGMTQFEVGTAPMLMGGIGTRLFMNRRSTFKFELRDYYDFKANVGNRLNILVGAGILLGAPSL